MTARERRWLKTCARGILTHDIYGHMSREILAECKEVLNDGGQFLLKPEEQESEKEWLKRRNYSCASSAKTATGGCS